MRALRPGEAQHCNHLNPPGVGDPNTARKMVKMARDELRFDVVWAVVNPGNALCAAVFRRKADAERHRRERASAYVVVRACVTPPEEPSSRTKEGP